MEINPAIESSLFIPFVSSAYMSNSYFERFRRHFDRLNRDWYQRHTKTAKKTVVYFLSKPDSKDLYKPEAVLAAMVIRGHYGWCHSTEDKISYIFFWRKFSPISRRLRVTAKKTKLQKTKIGCYGNVPGKFEKKSRFRSFFYSRSGTERWNHVKIRPVEVEIIGLTKTVKNMKHQYNIGLWLPGWPN